MFSFIIDGPRTRVITSELLCYANTIEQAQRLLKLSVIPAVEADWVMLPGQLVAPIEVSQARAATKLVVDHIASCVAKFSALSKGIRAAAAIFAGIDEKVKKRLAPKGWQYFFGVGPMTGWSIAANTGKVRPYGGEAAHLGITAQLAVTALVPGASTLSFASWMRGKPRTPLQISAGYLALFADTPFLYGRKGGAKIRVTQVGPDGKVISSQDTSNPSAAGQLAKKDPLTLLGMFPLVALGSPLLPIAGWAGRNLGDQIGVPAATGVVIQPNQVVSTSQMKDPSELAARIENLPSASQQGAIEIQRHLTYTPDGKPVSTWSVIIRGTQMWGGSSGNPQDMASNLRLTAGITSDQEAAVQSAMAQAGIKSGDSVEMVGHSQAAAVVANLSSDPMFSKKYNIVSTLNLGGPTGAQKLPSHTQTLEVENDADLVPTLDGTAPLRAPNRVLVRVNAGSAFGQGAYPHDIAGYKNSLRELSQSENADIRAWQENRIEKLHLNDPNSTTTVHTFVTERLPR